MVQPKTPPLSVRLGEVRLAKIDAYATKRGLKRHAAVLELIDIGLDGTFSAATSRPTPKAAPGSPAAERKAERGANTGGLSLQLGPTPRKPGDLMKKGKAK